MSADNKTRQALVLSHIVFEDLGTFEATLRARGFKIESVLAAEAPHPLDKAQTCDLLIVMGGPMGVYEQDKHPFLKDEIALIAERLAARKPALGVCLGAQLMAAALGARVYPGANGKEIGWSALQPAPGQPTPTWFAPLLADHLQVLHWHGDTFDLPAGVRHLASSALYANQAFAVDDFALALQFHPEVTAPGLESWYEGHAAELSSAGISIPALRSAAQRHAPALAEASNRFLNGWLDKIL
ncbi:MAG: glutamine amidotransferase [Terracidiphilus sp.]|jgi:GMP synthase (glutamine-hydrolysing)